MTCHRFGRLADLSVRQSRVQRLERIRRATPFNGDKSPAQSADKSAHSKTSSLSPLLLFVWFACFAVTLSSPAATFTTNALITETNTSFDGQDIVVIGATLTVDGRHSSPCS